MNKKGKIKLPEIYVTETKVNWPLKKAMIKTDHQDHGQKSWGPKTQNFVSFLKQLCTIFIWAKQGTSANVSWRKFHESTLICLNEDCTNTVLFFENIT